MSPTGQKHLRKTLPFIFIVLMLTAVFSFFSAVDAYAEEILISLPSPTPAPSKETPPASLVYEKQCMAVTLMNSSKYAVVNGKNTVLEAASYMSGSQLMAPVKSLSQVMGAKFEYNAKTKTAVVTRQQTKIVLKAGTSYAYVNNAKIALPAAVSAKLPVSAPVRFIAESLGASYSWNGNNKTASITMKDKFLAFPDKELEMAVRKALNKASGDLSLKELKSVFSISSTDGAISNLNGIQYLTGLGSIYITGSKISDISYLRPLKKLYSVSITKSNISDPSPLSELSDLILIDLSDNCIKDAASLKGLKKLHYLNVSNNFISNPTPLLELPANTEIILWDSAKREDLKTIYGIASDIVAKVVKPGMSDLDKELALHDYLLASVHYDNINFENNSVPEESHHPLAVFTKGVGVCDGYSEAMQILLNMAGIECRVVIGNAIGPGATGHAWNILKLDGVYYHLDATFDDPVSADNTAILSHRYFNLSDRQMGSNHKWDRKLYPECSKDNPRFEPGLRRQGDMAVDSNASYSIENNVLYRINPDGSYIKLCEQKVSCLNMSDGWLYFINHDDSDKVYRISTEGKEFSKVSDYSAHYLSVENTVIYIMSSNSIYKLDSNFLSSNALATEDVLSYIWLNEDWIYYKAYDWGVGTRLCRIKTDGSGKTLLTGEKPAGYKSQDNGSSVKYTNAVEEIYEGNYIYFINESDSCRLYRCALDGSQVEKVCDDVVSGMDIEAACGWIYYRNANDGSKYYRIRTDGSERQLADM